MLMRSFTGTLAAFIRGEFEPDQYTRYSFNCKVGHIFRKDGLIPPEVSWHNTVLPESNDYCTPYQIDPDILLKWRDFKAILDWAREEDRLRCGLPRDAEWKV